MMNDFTKDELGIILLEMNISIHRVKKEGILKISPIYLELRDKVEAMIDNYCEHEYRLSGADAIYCHKCEKHIWWKL